MKRRTMTKSDLIFKLIGQATVVVLFHIGGIAMLVWGFMQNTIY